MASEPVVVQVTGTGIFGILKSSLQLPLNRQVTATIKDQIYGGYSIEIGRAMGTLETSMVLRPGETISFKALGSTPTLTGVLISARPPTLTLDDQLFEVDGEGLVTLTYQVESHDTRHVDVRIVPDVEGTVLVPEDVDIDQVTVRVLVPGIHRVRVIAGNLFGSTEARVVINKPWTAPKIHAFDSPVQIFVGQRTDRLVVAAFEEGDEISYFVGKVNSDVASVVPIGNNLKITAHQMGVIEVVVTAAGKGGKDTTQLKVKVVPTDLPILTPPPKTLTLFEKQQITIPVDIEWFDPGLISPLSYRAESGNDDIVRVVSAGEGQVVVEALQEGSTSIFYYVERPDIDDWSVHCMIPIVVTHD